MITKRIIPCLDVRDGRVVKGVNFKGVQDVASPIDMARYYNQSGADELVFYDITASVEGRGIFTEVLKEVASQIFIPLTVGGGINSLDDFDRVLKCGADKVSVNSGAIKNPELIKQAALKYGNQCVVLSMDVKKNEGKYTLFTKGGKENTGIDALDWVEKCVGLGAGEVVVNSIDTDGVKGGFDLEMLKAVSERVDVPIIASGGAGSKEDFVKLFENPAIDAGLAASIFHFKEIEIKELKKTLIENGYEIRMWGKKMEIKFDKNGLVPAVVQDYYSKQVLTLAYMNKESLDITISEGKTCFYSRSRKELWRKGETSGNYQKVINIKADCDGDSLVIEVIKDGPACHTGEESCFFNTIYQDDEATEFSYGQLYNMLKERKEIPKEGSYTTYLFEKGKDKILKKIGEECTEVIIGAAKDNKEETIYEIADLAYHIMVLMVQEGIEMKDLAEELASRHVVDKKIKQEKMK